MLEFLAGHEPAAEIVLGGGIALAHCVDYRDTFDLDARWAVAPTAPANALLDEAMQTVAARHGMTCVRRSWGETVSLELVAGQRKVFSLQIAPRDRYLDATLEAEWSPVRIETLRANVASKMNALVNRGASMVSGRLLPTSVMNPRHDTISCDTVFLDHSVYPDLGAPPDLLTTPEEKADYLHRVCAAFDFGIFPERDDWSRFASWRAIFDAYPLPDSPAYHTFRAWFGWPSVARGTCGLVPPWRVQDLRERRTDPCERTV